MLIPLFTVNGTQFLSSFGNPSQTMVGFFVAIYESMYVEVSGHWS